MAFRRASLLLCGLSLAAAACAPPVLSPDGQLVFAEPGGTRGASVLTANGVMFLDRADLPPQPIVRASAYEPWQPATGFLLPKDGVWSKTSHPVTIASSGMSLTIRTSDALLPSWGGEVLTRIDISAPEQAFEPEAGAVREPLRLAVIVDGGGEQAAALVETALDGLGRNDRTSVIATASGRPVLPPLPGNHRTLITAAAEHAAHAGAASERRMDRALSIAKRNLGPAGERRVLVVSDGRSQLSAEARDVLRELHESGVHVVAVPTHQDADLDAALFPTPPMPSEAMHAWLAGAFPPPGAIVLRDVRIHLHSVPAPARILEASGGAVAMRLDHDELRLGDLYVGESRTEVLRIALPVWVVGEGLELLFDVSYRTRDSQQRVRAEGGIGFHFSDDVERLADNRHGDVIAYASALAMVRRLDRAFLRGTSGELAEMRPLIAWQAESLDALGAKRRDPALREQAEVLETLLGALPPQ